MNTVDFSVEMSRLDSSYMAELAKIDQERNELTAKYNADRNRLMTKFLEAMDPEAEDEVFKVPQAAEFLNVSVWKIRQLVQNNEIPFKLVGEKSIRFSKHELIRYQRGEWKSEAEQIADAYVAKSLRLRK